MLNEQGMNAMIKSSLISMVLSSWVVFVSSMDTPKEIPSLKSFLAEIDERNQQEQRELIVLVAAATGTLFTNKPALVTLVVEYIFCPEPVPLLPTGPEWKAYLQERQETNVMLLQVKIRAFLPKQPEGSQAHEILRPRADQQPATNFKRTISKKSKLKRTSKSEQRSTSETCSVS